MNQTQRSNDDAIDRLRIAHASALPQVSFDRADLRRRGRTRTLQVAALSGVAVLAAAALVPLAAGELASPEQPLVATSPSGPGADVPPPIPESCQDATMFGYVTGRNGAPTPRDAVLERQALDAGQELHVYEDGASSSTVRVDRMSEQGRIAAVYEVVTLGDGWQVSGMYICDEEFGQTPR